MSAVSISGLVANQAERRPTVVAIEPVDAAALTWMEVADLAGRWGAALNALGVRRLDPVLTMLPNGPGGYLGWIACAWVGAVEFPVNHAYTGDWLERIVDDSGAKIAIIAERFLAQWAPLVEAGRLDRVIVIDGSGIGDQSPEGGIIAADEFMTMGGPAVGPVRADAHDVSCVVYTSGTTGRSKGVLVPWGQWEARSRARFIPAHYRHSGDRFYSVFQPFHSSGREVIYNVATYGSTAVPRESFKTSEWLNDIRQHRCIGSALIGAMVPFVWNTEARDDDADNPLKYVTLSPIPAWIDKLKNRFGIEICATYSTTEIPFPFCSAGHYEVTAETSRSCGKASGDVDFRLVAPDGSLAGDGEIGELEVRGKPWELNYGYVGLSEATQEAWRDGWFQTGDLFRSDEAGFFYFVDRAKDMIRRRGENISSFEVEAAVNTHEAVQESAAYAVPSEWGEDEVTIAVVLQPNATCDPAALHAHLSARLPRFAVPSFIQFVDALPRTPTEKVAKHSLRAQGVLPSTWRHAASSGRVSTAAEEDGSGLTTQGEGNVDER